MSWASVGEALQLWPSPGQAPDDATLQLLLDASTERLEAFAPKLPDPPPDPLPYRYRYANVLDAHDMWSQARDSGRDDGTMFDPPSTFAPPRGNSQVRSLLRPGRGPVLSG